MHFNSHLLIVSEENDLFLVYIGSGFEELGDTLTPKIVRGNRVEIVLILIY